MSVHTFQNAVPLGGRTRARSMPPSRTSETSLGRFTLVMPGWSSSSSSRRSLSVASIACEATRGGAGSRSQRPRQQLAPSDVDARSTPHSSAKHAQRGHRGCAASWVIEERRAAGRARRSALTRTTRAARAVRKQEGRGRCRARHLCETRQARRLAGSRDELRRNASNFSRVSGGMQAPHACLASRETACRPTNAQSIAAHAGVVAPC